MFVPYENRRDGELKRGRIGSVIDDAIDLLRSGGWCGFNPRRYGGRGQCLGYAVAFAAIQNKVDYHEVANVVLDAAYIQTGKRWQNIPAYNDAEGRTFSDIEAVVNLASSLP